jgi:hypothetical protein
VFNTNETKPNKSKGKGMGLVMEQNPQNQRARPLVNVKRLIKIVRRRSQNKAIEKLSRMDHPFQIKGV